MSQGPFKFIDETAHDDYIYFKINDYDDNSYISRLSKDGENSEQLVSGGSGLNIERIIDDYIYYSELSMGNNYIARIKRDGSDNRIIAEGDNVKDFYVGKNNIYYIQADKSNQYESVVRADLNGGNAEKFDLPQNLYSGMNGLLAENEGIIYLSLFDNEEEVLSEPQSDIYEYDFDTMKLDKADIINYKAYSDGAVTDGKYIYYKVTKAYGFSQPLTYYYIYKCDMDKSNETDLKVMNLDSGERLFSYENYMYTTISDNGINIARVHSNGETQKITDYTEYSYMVSILEVSDDIIYYKMTKDNDIRICCINTDGSDNKILYKL